MNVGRLAHDLRAIPAHVGFPKDLNITPRRPPLCSRNCSNGPLVSMETSMEVPCARKSGATKQNLVRVFRDLPDVHTIA